MKKFTVLLLALALTFAFSMSVFATGTEEVAEQGFDFFEWMKGTFTVEKVVSFISAFTSACMTVIVTKIIKRIGKDKEINTAQLNKTIENGVKDILGKALYEYQKPFIDKVNELQVGFGKIVKGIALLQDGTPQSKLAMYDLIESTGIVEKSTIETCKADVEKQIEEEEQTKQENVEKLEKIIVPLE